MEVLFRGYWGLLSPSSMFLEVGGTQSGMVLKVLGSFGRSVELYGECFGGKWGVYGVCSWSK